HRLAARPGRLGRRPGQAPPAGHHRRWRSRRRPRHRRAGLPGGQQPGGSAPVAEPAAGARRPLRHSRHPAEGIRERVHLERRQLHEPVRSAQAAGGSATLRRTVSILLLLASILPAAAPAFAQRSSAEAEVAFTYGVRAFNHGDFAEAVRRFQEAVAADPRNREAREWLDVALRRQREAAAPGGAVATPGFGGLLALRDQPRFDFRAGAALGQDSNPAELPDDVIAVGSNFGPLVGEVDDKVTDLDLRAAVYPFYSRSGWSLGLAGQMKAARYQDLDFLSESQWSAAVQIAWGTDPSGYLTGPLGYTRVPFGHSRVSFLLQAGRTDTRLDGDPLV